MSHQFLFSPHILDNLPIPDSGFDVVQDITEPRLRMYITARGIKTFFIRRRVAGLDQRIIIGRYPDTDILDARRRAASLLAEPARKPSKAKRKKITFGEITKQFVQKKVQRKSSSKGKLSRGLDRAWGGLYHKNLDSITAADLESAYKDIASVSGIPTANRMREALTGIFRYAHLLGYEHESPVSKLARIKESRRVRPLNAAGLRRILSAANKSEKDRLQMKAFLMLIYGFLPRSKIFAFAWRDLDFNNDTWRGYPLSDAASVLLSGMPQNGQYVFPGRGGRGHISDPRRAWKKLMIAAKTPNVRMDDVYKFMNRQLKWSADRETLRHNMNIVTGQLFK